MNDKISVNVVTYNHELFLAECLDSVLNQTHKNIEILITDDCSTDNTLKIANQYHYKYPDKIKVLPSKTNQGVVANANKGLQHATGDYFCSFAGDDIMLANNLKTQYETLCKNPLAPMSHGNAIWCQDTSDQEIRIHHLKPIMDNSYSCLLKDNFVCGPAALIRRTFLPDAYREKAGSVCDWVLYAEVMHHGDAVYIHEPLIKYRRHDDNLSSKYEMHLHAIGALNYIKDNIHYHYNIHLGYASQYRSMIKKNLINKRFIKAAKAALLYFYHKTCFKIKNDLS